MMLYVVNAMRLCRFYVAKNSVRLCKYYVANAVEKYRQPELAEFSVDRQSRGIEDWCRPGWGLRAGLQLSP